ncbi:molybdenum cofactor biosynthesis protein F [Halarchaeum nitratireducens]|uniref:Molybdenum cofactor biosynthesis protein F n=1 Tax=Halarchaeum nitratireducens TaxID=489913 RepID=A0A830GDU5_9EURY|nr:molybdenum cofactor biosynthesis protein F [Halarchaeum nitratireducens]
MPMGDIADEYEKNQMPATDSLSGSSYTLNFKDGRVVEYELRDPETLEWTVTAGSDEGVGGQAAYTATKPRDDIYFVDHMRDDAPRTSTSLVLDLNRGIATSVTASIPASKSEMPQLLLENANEGKSLSAGDVAFDCATIGQPFTEGSAVHERTDDLTGKRMRYTYSDNSVYEHIYLNEERYVWHCLRGEERGLAEASPCSYYEIADGLYMIVWEEVVLPVIGVVLIDFHAMKTTGKMLCDDKNDFEGVVNIPMGAHAEQLNVTPTLD